MKTKKNLLLIVVLVFSLLAAACSSSANPSTSSGGTSQAQNPGANAPGNDGLSLPTKLAIGTLKLDGTDQAVTTEQSTTLLTLWQAYSALSTSDTVATAELDAVIKQIQSAMTAEQLQAIDDMQLTRQSMAEVLQTLGMDFAPAGAQQTPVAGQSATGGRSSSGNGGFPGGAPSDGGGPGGGGMPPGGEMPADGGGGPGFGAQGTPDATAQARFGNQATRVSPMLLNALVKVLETKIATPTPEP